MVSAPYARKNGEKLKLPFVPSRPISRNQFCQSHGRSHDYIYLYRTADAWPDLQTHGRTHRRADGHAEARTDMQKHGHRCRHTDADAEARPQKHGRTDADASARWRTDAKYSCVQCMGGKIVQTRPASG